MITRFVWLYLAMFANTYTYYFVHRVGNGVRAIDRWYTRESLQTIVTSMKNTSDDHFSLLSMRLLLANRACELVLLAGNVTSVYALPDICQGFGNEQTIYSKYCCGRWFEMHQMRLSIRQIVLDIPVRIPQIVYSVWNLLRGAALDKLICF